MKDEALGHQCKYPDCNYPCPDLPDCQDADRCQQLEIEIKALEEKLAEARAQLDMPKIGCVNHDCEKCAKPWRSFSKEDETDILRETGIEGLLAMRYIEVILKDKNT